MARSDREFIDSALLDLPPLSSSDVCVLPTVLNAVDLAYRVTVAADAICSSVDKTHDAPVTLYSERFGEQIELADTDTVLQSWQDK